MKRWVLVLLVGCGKAAPSSPPSASPPEKLPFLELADFEFKERQPLPEKTARWNGKYVEVTGFINPMNETRNLKKFYLVKDRASCCFGKAPQINHFIDVTMRGGQTVNYSTDPVTVRGVLQVGEVWDGDWLEAIFRMKDAELVK
jgi:hypothetical protein